MVRVTVVVVTLSAFFIFSEAAVTLEVLSGLSKGNAVECGKDDVIRCVVSPFSGYMAWTANSQSLIECYDSSDNDCSSLSVDHYTFSSKLSDETFDLTFNTSKLSDGSVVFTCTDTVETASVTPSVKVMPDTATTTNTSSGLELEVKTGCVYPGSAITFEWYYMDNGDRKVLSIISEETEDSTDCTIGTFGDCGGANVTKITSRLTTDSVGDEYNIYVDVKHSDAPENDPNYVVTKSFGMFKVAIATTEVIYICPEFGNSTVVDNVVKCTCVWILICLAILLGIILIGIALGCLLTRAKCCCDCFKKGKICVDCVSNCYCRCECFASTPCGVCCNIRKLPSWYQVLWATIIGIPIALGIWLVWRCCNNANRPGGLDQADNGQPLQGNPV